MYNRATESDVQYLRSVVSAERVLSGSGIKADYAHDELAHVHSIPDVVVRVKSAEEISAVMSNACEKNIPVVVRGSGTGLVGAAVALEQGIMIDTTLMNRILELDKDNLTVTVEPGVLLMNLAEFAAQNGFLYPPDPGEKSATIGGNISTNAGGMRAVKYGVTRDYVLGLTVVLPNGRIEKLGGKAVKNSSGYSLKNLVVGSEGTLCVISEAILKLVPMPEATVSLLVPFDTMDSALDAVPEIIRSKTVPTAVEYFPRETLVYSESYLGKKNPNSDYPAYVLLTFDGASDKVVSADCDRAAELCLEMGAADVFIVDTDERKDSVWKSRGSFLEAIKASTSEMDECDVVVPRSSVADFIKFTHAMAKKYDIRIPSFGHAGDGNLHIYICRDELPQDVWREKLESVFGEMYKKAEQMGGQVSGEHGIGWATARSR